MPTDPQPLQVVTRDVGAELAELGHEYPRWRHELATALTDKHGMDRGRLLLETWGRAFPLGYIEEVPVARALHDIDQMERQGGSDRVGTFYSEPGVANVVRFRACWADQPPLLHDVLPILASLGLDLADHRSYQLAAASGRTARIDDFGLRHSARQFAAAETGLVEDAVNAMWGGHAERDGLNRLVLAAGINWREAALIRAAYRYIRLGGFGFSQRYVAHALAEWPVFVRLLLQQFRSRFDTAASSDQAPDALESALAMELDKVTRLDEDRTLRSLLAFFQSVTRTNFYVTGPGQLPSEYFSFKIDPSRMPFLPAARPLVEMFVYSTRVEALHLRAARVARGGIRWSDRPEDFRTEVLGLMKAQAVKNTLIVPGGAKGAFVIKRPLADLDRDAVAAEARHCYTTFINGMLDLTDNLVDGTVQPPTDLVCHDGPDHYLVVAADKGTATMSDLANSIAEERGFWLGDAFASGGSTGFDHKKMGITARGAWVSLERHFEDLASDVDQDEFTVVGIGDLSGDVFGNGMLLSPHIRLVGAFDHRHVFLDPNPDVSTSFAERLRLANLPGSTWQDYDPARISAGGGVFSRSAKSIPLSPEIQALLGLCVDALSPPELIQAILRASVDVLWNGGIGTFVKASTETHPDAADPVNDGTRVDACELRCRVVIEGGNLGLTQRARVEYAHQGGRINGDFIDNSAGVDTSDREVNIKMVLNDALAEGGITRTERDKLLVSSAEDVAAAVLDDSRQQNRMLSVLESDAPRFLDQHAHAIEIFEREEGLDRAAWALPGEAELAERRQVGLGLTRPEIAVLLAFAKNTLARKLLDSDVPDDPYLARTLVEYLPAALRERFGPRMEQHPMRREIVATMVSNNIAHRVGTGFFYRMTESTGASTPQISRAYLTVRDVFDLDTLWAEVDAVGRHCPPAIRYEMLRDVQRFAGQTTRWFIRNRQQPLQIGAEVSFFRPHIQQLGAVLTAALTTSAAPSETITTRTSQGVPRELAERIAGLATLASSLDFAEMAHDRFDVGFLIDISRALDSALGLDWLQSQIIDLPSESHWARLAKISLRDDLFTLRRRLTAAALQRHLSDQQAEETVDTWLSDNRNVVDHCRATLRSLRAMDQLDVPMLTVALQEIRNLAHAGSCQGPWI
ncbi:MAG: NAD-glutamate dehydrogenase domain-containing protein [Marmoricola sp.]